MGGGRSSYWPRRRVLAAALIASAVFGLPAFGWAEAPKPDTGVELVNKRRHPFRCLLHSFQ
jgi:hypothetical protein